MRPRLLRAAKLLAAAAAVLAGLVLLKPDTGLIALRLYLLLSGSVAVVVLIAAIRSVLPVPSGDFERALEPPPSRADQLGQLADVEREVELAVSRAFYFHSTLRPLLQQLAADRLRIRHGVALDDPLARELIGQRAWELIGPDREPPRDRVAPGPRAEQLRHVVQALEAL